MTIEEKVMALVGTAAQAHKPQIQALIEMCMDEAVQFCNLVEYTEKLDNAVVQMVLERFNRLNNEGVNSTDASGINESFIDGYSKSTYSMLVKNRKIRTVGRGKDICNMM